MKDDLAVYRIRTHPGDILRRELDTRGVSANQLALALGVPSGRIVEILNRKRGISADTALRLARYIKTSAEFWMNLQAQYDLSVVQQESGESIEARVQPADISSTLKRPNAVRHKHSVPRRRAST